MRRCAASDEVKREGRKPSPRGEHRPAEWFGEFRQAVGFELLWLWLVVEIRKNRGKIALLADSAGGRRRWFQRNSAGVVFTPWGWTAPVKLYPTGVVVVNVITDHLNKELLAGKPFAVIPFPLQNAFAPSDCYCFTHCWKVVVLYRPRFTDSENLLSPPGNLVSLLFFPPCLSAAYLA